jgi:hypothetical protein
MPALTPPSRERIKIVAKVPNQYSLQLETEEVATYPVPADGQVTVSIPSFRRSCRGYLFGVFKVSGSSDPLASWKVMLSKNGKPVRKLSVKKLNTLATDSDGYRLLTVAD